jgi:mRNA interferase MazF
MPGYRHPVLIVQANSFNRSRIRTVLAVILTSNLELAKAPGNVLLTARSTGLTKDSVANVSQILTIDKALLTEEVGQLNQKDMIRVETGLRLVLSL